MCQVMKDIGSNNILNKLASNKQTHHEHFTTKLTVPKNQLSIIII